MSSTVPRISLWALSSLFVCTIYTWPSSMTFSMFVLTFFGSPTEIVYFSGHLLPLPHCSVRTVQFPGTPLAGSNVGWGWTKKNVRPSTAFGGTLECERDLRRDTRGGRAKKLTVFATLGPRGGRGRASEGGRKINKAFRRGPFRRFIYIWREKRSKSRCRGHCWQKPFTGSLAGRMRRDKHCARLSD